ncbi:hypothetical protein ABRQ03_09900 [Pectobacterium jejuense]|uniref:hypothetical protein n=1 Tax=Pectobacterium jejuense TaxID=2974022 RepID=UPI0032F03C07
MLPHVFHQRVPDGQITVFLSDIRDGTSADSYRDAGMAIVRMMWCGSGTSTTAITAQSHKKFCMYKMSLPPDDVQV